MALFDQLDDPLGGPLVVPSPGLAGAAPLDLGLPMQRPMAPQDQVLRVPREEGAGGWQTALMTLIPALLAGIAGPKRPVGRGLAAVAQQIPQMAMQQQRFQLQQQQYEAVNDYRQQQIAARQDAEQRQRDQMAQRALTSAGAELGKLDDREAYEKNVARFGATFEAAGFPRQNAEALRRMFPFRPPDTAKLAEQALTAYYKNDLVKKRLDKDGPTAIINDVITIGKGPDAQRVPVLEAHKLAGQEMRIGEKDTIPLESLQQWPAAVLAAKQQFFDETKRTPTAQDNPVIFERAKALMANKDEADVEIARRLKELQVQNAELGVDVKQQQLAQGGRGGSGGSDIDVIADAIVSGAQPPTTQGMYRNTAALRAALARRGYNLTAANLDWQAAARHMATLNGPQQTRLRQALETADHSLDIIRDLAEQWQGGRFPALNKGRLVAAKQGALGPEAQKIATTLEAQITDVTSELSNVYMGGNSPTDQALHLATKNLSADWSLPQLLAALDLARRNLGIRRNSIEQAGAQGVSPTNPYAPPQLSAPPAMRFERDPKTGKLVKVGG